MRQFRKSICGKRGLSTVEVLVALVILGGIAASIFPFFARQRTVVNQYGTIGNCQAILTRTLAEIESGGSYFLESPLIKKKTTTTILPTQSSWKNVPEVFYGPKDKRVSFNVNNPRTFKDRFDFFNVPQNNGEYVLYKTLGPQNYKRADGRTVPAEADGVLLYTPLLMKGSIADLADLYNSGYKGTYAAAPQYFVDNAIKNTADKLEIMIKVDRILIKDKSVKNTDNKFWPIARNAYGNTDENDFDKYSIRPVEDLLSQKAGQGRYYRIGQLPQVADGIEMSWDYGFRLSLKAKYTEAGKTESVDCDARKEYFLPTDFHNVISHTTDFDFLDPADPKLNAKGVTEDQTILSSELSNKFFDSPPLVRSALSGTNTYDPPTAPPQSMVWDPTFLAIFANTNFGKDAKGNENVKNGKNRPECSQSGGKSRTFELRLRFKNLNKEPGVIPVCMDTSSRPRDLSTPDGTDYNWCPGAPNSNTIIKNDFLPGQTGFVPCEKMRFCGQTPEKVSVTSDNGNTEYRYQYTIRNDNNASGNRLWGCDIAYVTALLDAAGNISYIPKASVKLSDKILGSDRPIMGSQVPKIYFKPPPCYVCNCKPCKKSKSFFKLVLGILAIAAIIVSGGALGPILGTINFAGSLVGSLVAQGIVLGIVMVAAATCLWQGAGISTVGFTNGGFCGQSNNKADAGGGYRACSDQSQCKCGHTCSKVSAPDPINFDGADLPPGQKDASALAYCAYKKETRTTNGVTWIVQMGARFQGKIDAGSLINYANPTLIPNHVYSSVGDTSNYSMYDAKLGKYCFIQMKCKWNDSLGHADWVLNPDPVDGMLSDAEACWDVKVGYGLTPSTGGGITKGAAECLKVDMDPSNVKLEPCSYFNIACKNGTGVYNLSALTGNFGTASDIAGRSTGQPASMMAGFLPVQEKNPHCKSLSKDCGNSMCSPPTIGAGPGSRTNECNKYSYSSYDCGTVTAPMTCYTLNYDVFDYWYGCQPPAAYEEHMKSATKGTYCYEPYSASFANLPLCQEGGGIVSTNPPDAICPVAGTALCK